ncbi:heat shock protein 70 B2 [Nephila pilipes]|uniref:Heat shock protein 70 B2 n=1 Tax=Nephila pilipes TaxID=299642 RepID=A0A8X6NVK5_NEPPI|nr:heat shock protein 70 B2 [Nephila pilipes]
MKTVLIFETGDGTFDESVLAIDKFSLFNVRSTAGDTRMGGEDFDYRVVVHFIEEFKLKHRKDLRYNQRAVRRLRIVCCTKSPLSSYSEVHE